MLRANTQRVLNDLYHLRSIGTYKTGVHRPTLSSDDMIARKWLADQLHAIGHKATIDGIANVYGGIRRTHAVSQFQNPFEMYISSNMGR